MDYFGIGVLQTNHANDGLYSMQHSMMKLVSDLRQVVGFLLALWFPQPIQLTTTIILKYC
jgi:hypothetical protein